MAWVEGRVPEVKGDQQIRAAARWKVEEFICQSTKNWRTCLVRERFEWTDANSILAMEIPKNEAGDFSYWKGCCSGKYTVRLGYNFLQTHLASDQRMIDDHDNKFIRLMWKFKIPSKWKVLLWKIFYDGIAVKDNLRKRGMKGDVECDYYGNGS